MAEKKKKGNEESPVCTKKIYFEDKETGKRTQRRLTEKERMQVVASYIDTGELRGTARKFGITPHAVRYIVDNSPEFAVMYQKRRMEEAEELFAHMSMKYENVKVFIDNYMTELVKPEMMARMARTNMVGATVVLGTLLDKFAMLNKFAVERGDNGDMTLNVQIVRKKRDEQDDEDDE